MRETFATPEPITIHARLAAGEVVVETEETGVTVVDLEPGNDAAERLINEARLELRGRELFVEIPEHRGLFGRSPEFELRVRCPHGSSLQAQTASADIRSRGHLGDLDVKTASGDVEAEQVARAARVTTASGDIALGQVDGSATVNATSGDVEIARAGAGLRAGLVSGDLRVREAEGGVEASTVSGDVELGAVGPGSVRADTISGDVHVGVRPGCDVWMDVRSVSGDTSSELEASDGPPAEKSRLVELSISTVSGDVHIGRATATAGVD